MSYFAQPKNRLFNIYKDLLSRLASKLKIVLQTIAREDEARRITPSAFMKKYNLPFRAGCAQALLKSDLITQEEDVSGYMIICLRNG